MIKDLSLGVGSLCLLLKQQLKTPSRALKKPQQVTGANVFFSLHTPLQRTDDLR